MTEWSQAVWIAINLLIAAMVIGVTVYYFNIGHRISNEISRQEANRELMKEYREFNGFNDSIVYAQDAVSAVLHYRGAIGVRVMKNSNEAAYWCSDANVKTALTSSEGLQTFHGDAARNWSCNSATTDYTATKVQEKFDVNKVYRATLTYGVNGEILGITFTQGTVDGNGIFRAE